MSDNPKSNATQNNPTNNPLFGATPPSSSSTSPTHQAPVIESSVHGQSSLEGTTDPLFGATPPQPQNIVRPWDRPVGYDQYVPRELRLFHPPRTNQLLSSKNQPSKTIQFIKRITFILSFILGISSTIAGIWSIFLLPLLHSSFSARKALVDLQVERVDKLVEGLRKIRASGLYPPDRDAQAETSRDDGEEEDRNTNAHPNEGTIRREASLKEIPSGMTSLNSSFHSDNNNDPTSPHSQIQPRQTRDETTISEIIPYEGLSNLTLKLKLLSSAIESTSTTRTSLISTLESYTSSIHRQLFISRPTTSGYSSYSIGMNSLSNHLGQSTDGGNRDNYGLGGVKPEEWDNTRKEIRAIKGLLLNRRQFVNSK